MSDLLDRAGALAPSLVEVRRDLHRHPELGFHETRTAALAARAMEELDLHVRTGVGITGVVAELRNGPGPTVALRADMDALPVTEESEHAYVSTVPGAMHACGHDAHVAGLIGAANLLVQERDAGRLPPGTVRFLFQPSEEGVDEEGKSGAMRMLDDGALEGVDAVTGLHVGGTVTPGIALLSEGPVMGRGEEIRVTVRGRSAHAAMPEEGVDALVLAAQGILAAQNGVARRIPPTDPGVITFGQIQGGVAPNVLAGEVRITGTLRYFTEPVREALEAAVRAAFQGLVPQGAEVEVEFRPGYPPVVNDAGVTATVRGALAELFGDERVVRQPPVLLAEDFAFLARQTPGAFFWLGAAPADPHPHHHPRFDIDEAVLPRGAAALAAAAAALLVAG